MELRVESYWMPKAGNAASEYEDAFWPPTPLRGATSRLRLAVCDGATETSFSGSWARLLAKAYGTGRLDNGSLPDRLTPLRRRWERYATRKPLAWYAEEKVRDGAFAALIGLTLEDRAAAPASDGGPWSAVAVGDCCLFQTRAGRLVRSFPIEKAEQFDNRPTLIPSVENNDQRFREAIRRQEGVWLPGDVFYLMSDALACWSLAAWQRGENPLGVLGAVDRRSAFAELISVLASEPRDENPLKNDDVTLLRCEILELDTTR